VVEAVGHGIQSSGIVGVASDVASESNGFDTVTDEYQAMHH
jgi:hypothetical protein